MADVSSDMSGPIAVVTIIQQGTCTTNVCTSHSCPVASGCQKSMFIEEVYFLASPHWPFDSLIKHLRCYPHPIFTSAQKKEKSTVHWYFQLFEGTFLKHMVRFPRIVDSTCEASAFPYFSRKLNKFCQGPPPSLRAPTMAVPTHDSDEKWMEEVSLAEANFMNANLTDKVFTVV